MKTIINSIPGYRLYDYLVVISPHDELWNRIMSVKKEFAKKFSCENAKWGKPHLALLSFKQYEMMEERIVSRLKTIAMGYPPFKVELRGFGSFPSHTIFINVVSKIPVQGLIKKIREDGQRLMKLSDEIKPHFIMEPYIPVARKLQPWQYEKGWLEYRNKNFTGRFIADKMLLLKKPEDEMNYQVAQRLEFQNLPVEVKQGELFG